MESDLSITNPIGSSSNELFSYENMDFESNRELINLLNEKSKVLVFSPIIQKLPKKIIKIIEKDVLKKNEDFVPTNEINKFKFQFNIRDETILDENKILIKIPKIITISDALKEQKEFVRYQKQKEEKYRIDQEKELEKINISDR